MSDTKSTEKREEKKKKSLTPPGMSKPGVVPGFYWTLYQPKSYSTSSPLRSGFQNEQQKKFYMFMTVFKFVKIAAVILLALVIIGFL
jgi:hypothetical protein